jgi:hypothetical protein
MKHKKMLLYIFIPIALVAIILIVGKINLAIQFNKEVKELFSQSKDISNKTFKYDQLLGLPEPVQRYFKHVLKEGQPYINYVRLTHSGLFKTNLKKDWIDIKGEQYFTTEQPGFIWKGTTAIFIARDMYIGDRGRLVVSLLSLFNVVDASGVQYNQGELLRWLAESVWFPTNLLPSENLKWTAINDLTAQINYSYKGLSLSYIVSFNKEGEITQMETKRYMNEKNLETWICKMSDFKEINETLVPATAEAFWKLKDIEYSYAKFNVEKIEYNIPKRFKY